MPFANLNLRLRHLNPSEVMWKMIEKEMMGVYIGFSAFITLAFGHGVLPNFIREVLIFGELDAKASGAAPFLRRAADVSLRQT